MKISRILLVALMALAFSCSDDDEATSANSSLASASLSFTSKTTLVTAPNGMASSQDSHAIAANGWIASVNGLTNVLSYFTPPAGAVKSTTAITSSNGRVAESQTEYLVYVWTDANYGSVAYQISEQSDKWVFEVFYKGKDQTSWLSYLYAEEKKDKSAGLMKIYNVFGGDGEVYLTYTWTRSNDILTLVLSESVEGFTVDVTVAINEKTKAGSVVYTVNGLKYAETTWDAKGNGSWILYDEEDGKTIIDQGTWTV